MSRYQILNEINRGGMGVVYRALDRLTGNVVAVKKVTVAANQLVFTSKLMSSGDADHRLALAREFQILASLCHPNIIAVRDYGFERPTQDNASNVDIPFLTMDYLEDGRSILEAGWGEPLETKIDLVIQMLQGLAYLHRRGVIHRDLKPANVLVSGDQVKVLDFGLARIHRHDEAFGGRMMGTLAYMSPEALRGEPADIPADLYAAGLILYELLTDDFPYQRSDTGRMVNDILMRSPDLTPLYRLETGNPTQNSTRFIEIIERLLQKDPLQRPQNAEHLITELCDAAGFPEPIESAAVRESYLQAAQFVGRDEEIGLLLNALADAANGRGSAWLIGGESGVGKSRLLDELRTYALVNGALVVRGHAVSNGGLPYQAWRHPVRRLVIGALDRGELSDLAAAVLKEIVPDIATLIGREVNDPPKLDARPAQQRLMATLAELFRKQDQPILLILEDLQWALESLPPLHYLTQIVRDLPVLITASYRDDERPDLPGALPKMRPIMLQRLDADSIALLSESMLGESGRHPDVIELLQRETEGNVFFLVETARVLAQEAGRLSDVGRSGLPQTVFAGGVQAVLQRRLAQVPPSAHDFLKAAAILGRQVDFQVLRDFSPLKDDPQAFADLENWLTICANAAVLDWQDGHWRFSHDKLREALITELSPSEQCGYHQRAAEALERVYPNDDQRATVLVDHWRQAGNAAKEAVYLAMAAQQAVDAQQMREAAVRAERGLKLVTDDAHRIEFLLILGDAQVWLGDFVSGVEALQMGLALAERSGDTAKAAVANVRISAALWETGDYATALGYAHEGLRQSQAVGDQVSESRAYNTIANILWYKGEQQQAEPYYQKSYEVALAGNHKRLVGVALNNLGLVYQEKGDYTTALMYIRDSWAIKEELGDQRGIGIAMANMALLAARLGDISAEMDYLNRAIEIARKIGDRRTEGGVTLNLAEAYNRIGDLDSAVYFAEISLTIGREVGDKPGMINALMTLGNYALKRKNPNDAAAYIEESLHMAHSIGATPKLLESLLHAAWIFGHWGAIERAYEIIGIVDQHPALMDDVRATTMKHIRHNLAALHNWTADAVQAAETQGAALNFDALLDTTLRALHLPE